MKSSHFGTQRKVCTKCSSEILNANTSMKKHNETCGKGASKTHKTQEKSLEMCKHWRRGKCDRGSQCNFSHVGHQDALQHEKNPQTQQLSHAEMALLVSSWPKGGVVLATRHLAGTWLSRRKDGVILKAGPGLTREGDNRKKE